MAAVDLRGSSQVGSFHTWHSADFSSESWIDYSIISKSLENVVENFELWEDGICVSDHWPIILSLHMKVYQSAGSDRMQSNRGGLVWRNAVLVDLLTYERELEVELSQLDIPVEAAICNEPERCSHKYLRDILTVYVARCTSLQIGAFQDIRVTGRESLGSTKSSNR